MILASSLIGREVIWYEGKFSRTGTVVSVGYCAIQTEPAYGTNHHWRLLVVDEFGSLEEGSISEFKIIPLKEEKAEDPYRLPG